MIHINLLPIKEAQRAIGRRQQLSVALLSVSVALLVMVIPYALQGRRITQLDRDIGQLKAEIERYNAQTREVHDLEKKRTELQAKLKVIDELKQKRVGPVRMLEDLSAATPQKLWLVNFGEANGQATITGMALDNQTIAAFMRSLQSSPYFYDVDLVETAQSDTGRGALGSNSGMIFKKFIVKAQLDYLGKGGKAQAATLAPGAASKTGAS
jgi:type IV pilus assembly protein PilN